MLRKGLLFAGVLSFTISFYILTAIPLHAQESGYWQQRASYDMDIELDVETHEMKGSQKVVYTNNSPDTLHRIYYHLYFNAFQPNSMMDKRSRLLHDPDSRIGSRILHLSEAEQGYHHINKLTQNGQKIEYHIQNTVLEADLASPIPPGGQATFRMKFDSQIPLQVRRSGRDNMEGIDFSMTQWYPKIAEYTHEGWETHPYVQREFIGVWGDFNVSITLDSAYTVGGTGYLQNPQEVGHGYADSDQPLDRPDTGKLTWHFYAPNVHDFAWAADENYTHDTYKVPNGGPTVHLLYVDRPQTKHWDILGEKTVEAIQYFNKHIGTYPYKQYTVLQGGDGGMEYPMSTLITGHRSKGSLVGVMAHELAHSWFYGVLATNESRYPFMDEGFTTHYSSKAMQKLMGGSRDAIRGHYLSYLQIKYYDLEEPSITHADRFRTNYAYGVSSYSKGSAFLEQLSYIIGDETFSETIRAYYDQWKFKHPTPQDFKRVAEQKSGMQLDWYFNYWLHSTDEIDYAIEEVSRTDDQLDITLRRHSEATMPIDVQVEYEDGSKELHYIPLGIMRERKPPQQEYGKRVNHEDWAWTHPRYQFSVDLAGKSDIKEITLDPSMHLADVNRLNNKNKFPLDVHWLKPVRPGWDEYEVSARPALWYGQEAGMRIGFSSSGSYLFGDRALALDFFLTSGPLDDYGADQTDVDYNINYRKKLDQFGKETYLEASMRRYYGVFEEYVELEKRLGHFGILEEKNRRISLRAFHHSKTANRMEPQFVGNWESGDVFGFDVRYTHGNASSNGFQVRSVAATHRDLFSASFTEFTGNKTHNWSSDFSTRVGLSFGLGTQQLPRQFRWNLSEPTTVQLWNNETYTSFFNMVGQETARQDLNLVANGGNGLIGYGLPGIGSPDLQNPENWNNYWSATIWNSWTPLRGAPLTLELFAGTGKAWEGVFLGDMPVIADDQNKSLLASVGTGMTYDISELDALRRWTAQSKFLQKMQLSLRVPFYMHDLNNGHDEFKARFLFGISESF